VSFYVTTPIYYVNAAPHLGHAYTTIAVDALARHHRQRGEDVFFLTGTDEHGEPVADAAHALGIEPQALADKNAARFEALVPQLGAANDFFIRTTDPQHMAKVQEVLTRVRENGYVYEGTYEGWYCPRCADFKAENEVDEGNRCPIHHIELTREQEENYFFKLSAFQEPLERLYEEREDFVAPRTRYNEALSFLRSGLRDVPLSRHKLTWGVPVPWDEEHVFYVWFDALLNYYSALSYAPAPAANPIADERSGSSAGGEDLTSEFWPASYHVIAKDILRFHAIYWPALLMAAGLELPERIFVHGYLLMDGEKMSKLLGNVLDPFEVIERFGADALRFYLLRDVPFGQDGSVSTGAFEQRYSSELANDLGNLASRTLAMVVRYRDGVVSTAAGPVDPALAPDFDGLRERVAELIDGAELTLALEEIWERVRRLNRYVEEQAPWQLAKDESRAEDLRVVAVLLWPYLPASSERLLDALGAPDLSLAGATLGAGSITRVEKIESLFPKEA
jgi:methionyl-tRNA synthetase